MRLVLGVALVLAGAFLGVPIALGLGLVTVGFELVRVAWRASPPGTIGYRRSLDRSHIPFEDRAELRLEVWNRSRLPRSWVRTDDEISATALVDGRRLLPGDLAELNLRNTWTLGPRELVRRRLPVGGSRRGVVEIGPTTIATGDLFALPAGESSVDDVDRLVVWPRTVSAPSLVRRERVGGLARARTGLVEDPARFIGLRPYLPGDPWRRLHVRASVRLGAPLSKRFEPSLEDEVLVVLDLEPSERGPVLRGDAELERVEAVIVIAASLVRALARDRMPVGVVAGADLRAPRRVAYLAASARAGQAERALDLLARLPSLPTATLDRLVAFAGHVAREGTTVVIVTGRHRSEVTPAAHRLQRLGPPVEIVVAGATGPAGDPDAGPSGRIRTRRATLDGPWRTASRVSVE